MIALKIALSPDLHCYYNTYAASGVSFREEEWDRCADAMFETCKREKVDVLVAPGDFFTNPRPNAGQVLKVALLFERFEKAGIQVVGINGNHDIGSIGTKSMNDVVKSIGDTARWCASDFGTVVIDDVGFGLLPFVKDAQITAYNPEFATREMSDNLVSVAANLKEQLSGKVKKCVLVGHWSLSGAGYSGGMRVSDTHEVVLPCDELVRQKWDAILFGHIHKPQVLSKTPFVAYSGALQRINLGEAEDPRKFFIYDTKTGDYSEHAIPAIEMLVVRGEVNEESDIEKLKAIVSSANVEGKIVQIRYTVVKPLASSIHKKELVGMLAEKNPLKIAGVVPKVIDPTVQRLDFSESVDNATALRKWAEIKGYPKEIQNSLVDLMAKYDQEEVP